MKGEKTKINQLKQQGRRGDNSNRRENNVNQYDDDPDNVGSNNANPKQYKQTFKKKASVQRKKKKRNFFLFIYFQTHTCASAQKARYSACLLMRARVFFFLFFLSLLPSQLKFTAISNFACLPIYGSKPRLFISELFFPLNATFYALVPA